MNESGLNLIGTMILYYVLRLIFTGYLFHDKVSHHNCSHVTDFCVTNRDGTEGLFSTFWSISLIAEFDVS